MARPEHYPLPEPIAAYFGQILDSDAHDVTPLNHWVDVYGSKVKEFVAAQEVSGSIIARKKEADDTEITIENVLRTKFEAAPGAWDLDRRIEVMNFTGIDRAVLFPGNMPIFAEGLWKHADDHRHYPMLTGDRKKYASEMIALHNEWAVGVAKKYSRITPVAVLLEDSVDELTATMKKLIDRGVRLFQLPLESPPGGISPAHTAMDEFWALAADSGSAIIGHINLDTIAVLKSAEWRNAPAFEGWRAGAELTLDPWTTSNLHLPAQVFLTTMVLGGVFDRHPTLRWGCAEFTGSWVGPLAANLDRWVEQTPFARFKTGGGEPLKLRPSEYISRNARVALFDFEPVSDYINKFGLEDVYCFATDYPHYEGGNDTFNSFKRNTEGLSADVLRKFFVDNARSLLPDQG
ncbi:amidohydrolase family protein [Rhodoblastus sp.]|uniref:amidohydrolase family protein n=1 Tax=Rhodoblastus sp. TaxID=1962975 RepID=UPI003F9C782E